MMGIGLVELIIIAAMAGIPLLIIIVVVAVVISSTKSRGGGSVNFRPCPKCGFHAPEAANFCQQCGASLVDK